MNALVPSLLFSAVKCSDLLSQDVENAQADSRSCRKGVSGTPIVLSAITLHRCDLLFMPPRLVFRLRCLTEYRHLELVLAREFRDDLRTGLQLLRHVRSPQASGEIGSFEV